MDIKLFDSELKVMDVLWKQGDTPAREIARAGVSPCFHRTSMTLSSESNSLISILLPP